MLISILGAQTFSPGNWHNQFKVGLGLDLSSGTQVVLKAATPNGAAPSSGGDAGSPSGSCSTGSTAPVTPAPRSRPQGNDQITVTVPGKAATSVVNLIEHDRQAGLPPGAAVRALHRRPTPAATPTGQAERRPRRPRRAPATASATASPTPSASSTASASAKASTSDVSAELASPTRHHHASTASAKATTSSSTAKATATPEGDRHPERQPGCHRRRRPPPTATRRRSARPR